MSWDVAPLTEVATIDRHGISPKNLTQTSVYVGLEHIDSANGIQTNETVASATLRSTKFGFTPRHILFGKLRPYLAKIARPAIHGVCSTDILPILPSERLDKDYLYYFLRQPSQVRLATLRSSGANLPRLSPKELGNFKIPLPPLPEQKRIAAILDAADALRAKRRETLAQLDALLQSTFLDLFGDPVTNPMGWDETLISAVGKVQGGLQLTSKRKELAITKPYLRVANVYRNNLRLEEIKEMGVTQNEAERTQLVAGDLLVVEGHGNKDEIGRCAIWDGSIKDCVHQNHLIRVRLNTDCVLSTFASTFLNTEGGARRLKGQSRTTSGLNTISVSKVRHTVIPLPPVNLQHQFARIVEAVEQQKARQRAHLAELDTLFAALQARAFNGEL